MSWQRTPAWFRVVTVTVFGVGMALATGRYDLVPAVAPVLLTAVLALSSRPAPRGQQPELRVGVAPGLVAGSTVGVGVSGSATGAAELVTVALPRSTTDPQGRLRTLAVPPDGAIDIRQEVRVRGWGPAVVARPDTVAVGPDGLTMAGPQTADRVEQLVLPGIVPLDPLPLPPIVGGWAGSHRSRRLGQGSDLVDLRAWQPGDKLRSVHWRAYARRGELLTRRTLSEAEAEIALCLDVRQVIGPRPAPEPVGLVDRIAAATRRFAELLQEMRSGDREAVRRDRSEAADRVVATTLDLTVQATVGIAAAHLGAGDRVSVQTIDSRRRSLRHGSGTRQLHQIRYLVATLAVRSIRLLPVELWRLRAGAVVVLVSPLLDDEVAEAARECRGRGHQVVVVDVLPLAGVAASARAGDLPHLRVLSLERELRLERVRAAGIPVLRWDGGLVTRELTDLLVAMRGRR